jgi:uncharacterized membrane protein/glutaredoxin
MSRRRQQTPWIQLWSRPLIGAIAILGAINTGYITLTKLLGSEAACPTSGCEQVLSSPYADLFGLPLSLFGLLAYMSMAAFALVPLAVKPEQNKQLRTNLENWTWLLLFIGSTAMLVFSSYLMYIMFSQFVAVSGVKGICYYCIASALFAASLFALTLLGRTWEDSGQLVMTGVVVAMVVLVGSLGVYSGVGNSSTDAPDTPGEAALPITTTSGPSEIALAQHLRSIGAKMYSAYWCPHCHDQKQLFGRQAFRNINYVECDPAGQNSQAQLCQDNAQNITGYPTWEIKGQYYNGTKTLTQLADLSSYQGSRNFQNGG